MKSKFCFLFLILSLIVNLGVYATDVKPNIVLGKYELVSQGKYSYSNATVTGSVKTITITVDCGSFEVSGYTPFMVDIKGQSKTYEVSDAAMAQCILRTAVFDIKTDNPTQKVTVSLSSIGNDFSVLPNYASTKMSQMIINGIPHYYAYVQVANADNYNLTNSVDFSQAWAYSKSMKFNGLKGYLVTVLSQDEDKMLDNITTWKGWGGGGRVTSDNARINGDTFTGIGASSGSTWYWLCGPEAGTPFTNNYTNWAGGEPNGNGSTGEYAEYLLMLHHDSGKKWNDIRLDAHKQPGFFVEWSEDTRTSGYFSYSEQSVDQSELYIYYVKADGNDSTGNGSLTAPYASIKKANDSISLGGTIALLSNVNIGESVAIANGKTVVITSAKSDGSLLDNEPNNYEGVYSILRGTSKGSFISMDYASTLKLKQIILDGECKPETTEQAIIYASSNSGNVNFVMDTNSVIKNNDTSSNSSCWASAVVFGIQDNTTSSPTMYMKSNSKITGCLAARHGGAMTAYRGNVYMQDDSSMEYNGISCSGDSVYFGGGAILAYGANIHLSDNAKICNNFVQLNNYSDGGKNHNAVMIDSQRGSVVYLSGNAKIFNNFDDGHLTVINDSSYTLKGTKQANLYGAAECIKLEGALGSQAKIGITINNGSVGTVVANGYNYSLKDYDAKAFVDDTNQFSIQRNADSLLLASNLKNISLELTKITENKVKGKFSESVPFTHDQILVFKNGTKLTSGYTLKLIGEELTVSFDSKLALNDTIAVFTAKNGHSVNNGNGASITYKHSHVWSFKGEDERLVAYCSNSENSESCDYQNFVNGICLTMESEASGQLVLVDITPNASNKNVTWYSSDKEVVEVDSTGKLTGFKNGTVSVYAYANDGSGVYGSSTVIVQGFIK